MPTERVQNNKRDLVCFFDEAARVGHLICEPCPRICSAVLVGVLHTEEMKGRDTLSVNLG